MVALLLAGMAAFAQAPAEATPRQTCILVTPRGDRLGFEVLHGDERSDDIDVVGMQDSVWPPRTLPGSRAVMEPGSAHHRRFAFGARDGLVLELGEFARDRSVRPATLFRREVRSVGLPLAFGFCRPNASALVYGPIDPHADPRTIGADGPVFDPSRWPEEDCALLLSDGRQTRLRFTLRGGNQVEITSPYLSGGRPVLASIRWSRDATGLFGRRGGPSGIQSLFVREGGASAVKLIRFQQLGDVSSGQTGYAICGYRNITRRAAPQ